MGALPESVKKALDKKRKTQAPASPLFAGMSALPDDVQKAWDNARASREALGPPLYIDPVTLVQSVAMPMGTVGSLLTRSLAARVGAGTASGSSDAILNWLEKNDPKHPYWNTALSLLAGILAGGKIQGSLERHPIGTVPFEAGAPEPKAAELPPIPMPSGPGPSPPLALPSAPNRVLPRAPSSPWPPPPRALPAGGPPPLGLSPAPIRVPPGGFDNTAAGRLRRLADKSEDPKVKARLRKLADAVKARGGIPQKKMESGKPALGKPVPGEEPHPALPSDLPSDLSPLPEPPSKPVTMHGVLIPGLDKVVEEVQKTVGDGFSRLSDEFMAVFAPQMKDATAAKTAEILRAHGGRAAQEKEKAYAGVEALRNFFDHQPPKAGLDFMHAMETGVSTGHAPLDAGIGHMRQTFDRLWDQMHGMGLISGRVTNYFPHIWRNEKAGEDFVTRLSRSWEGSKFFTKRRFYQTIEDGMKAGNVLASDNPVELFLLAVDDMTRLVHARQAFDQLKGMGIARYVPVGKSAPGGYVQISDRIAKILHLLPRETVDLAKEEWADLKRELGGDVPPEATQAIEDLLKKAPAGWVHTGDFYLPAGAAQVIENYLSRGLAGRSPIYDMAKNVANALNQFQLGISAFHLSFVSLDSANSTIALGVQEASRSGGTKAAGKIAKGMGIVPAIAKTYHAGNQLYKAYLDKIPMTPELRALVTSLVEAGGRIHIDPFYRGPSWAKVKGHFRHGRILHGTFAAPLALLETVSSPLFEHYVPRMKLGVFSQMAQSIMEGSPGKTIEELRPELQKAWDSVDNRLGMMVYDNLFWNRAAKDLALLSVRSTGWDLGTVRELGGGAYDLAQPIGRVLTNAEQRGFFVKDMKQWASRDPNMPLGVFLKKHLLRGGKLSPRAAYLPALVFLNGMMGGTYYYLKNGTAPPELIDWFYPWDGTFNPDGSKHRVAFPTYVKDLFAYGHSVSETLIHKLNPLWEMVYELSKNKDFYGNQIVSPGSTAGVEAEQVGGYLLNQIQPFSFRNFEIAAGHPGELLPSMASIAKTPKHAIPFAEAMMGITSAPRFIGQTEAQKLLHQLLSQQSMTGGRTPEQTQKSTLKRQILQEIRNKEDYQPDLKKAIQGGQLNRRDLREMFRSVRLTPLQNGLRHLGLRDSLLVYRKATPAEKKDLFPIIARKLRSLKTMSAQQREDVGPLVNQLFLSPGGIAPTAAPNS